MIVVLAGGSIVVGTRFFRDNIWEGWLEIYGYCER